MINPDQRDFTVRTFTADRLRDRWAYHNVRTIVGLVADALLMIGFAVCLIDGSTAGVLAFFALEAAVGAWTYYHFGAARTITRMSFGEDW